MMDKELEPIADQPMSAAHGVAAVALGMALRYYDTSTVQEGGLYQQLKLEGRNIQALHPDMVLDLAKHFERHIMEAPNRLSEMVIDAVIDAAAREPEDT